MNNNTWHITPCHYLKHRSGGISSHYITTLLQFIEVCCICLCTALTTAFQSGWGLDFDWAFATPWFFSFQPFCCRFACVLGIINLAAWPNLGQALAVRRMSSYLTLEYLVYRGVHGQFNDCEVPRSCGYKTSPKSSPLHQHVYLLGWGDVCAHMLFRFSSNLALCIVAKNLHFGLICSKDNGSHSLIIAYVFRIYTHIWTSHENFPPNSQHVRTHMNLF